MKGNHYIEVRNRFVVFKLNFDHNISILTGDSGTGKSTLMAMIRAYNRQGKQSGVTIKCDKSCIFLDGQDWKLRLENIHDSIVFVDEGSDFIRTETFAHVTRESDNYYVLATRDNLTQLPYSINAIYELKGRKYGRATQTYNENKRIYGKAQKISTPKCLIVEDGKSGFQFFQKYAEKYGVKCCSANGNGNLRKTINEHHDEDVVVIADGAALGAYMKNLVEMQAVAKNKIFLFLPESFEWLLLKADLQNDKEVREILEAPSEYIESAEYFSWERFFTTLLVDKTADTYLAYSKDDLNPVYIQPHEMQQIEKNVPIFEDKASEGR